MEDIKIKISKESRMVYLSKSRIGNEAENLQGNLVFSFKDEFVNGQARLELTIDGQNSWIPLLKEEETYYCPIKSAITKKGQIDMQLVITENEDEDGIPIFKSNVFYMHCDKSINAEIEQPEEYPTWIEIANEKLNEMDNLDIEAEKVGNNATITITKKDGTEQSVEITDGETGPQGETGPAGQDAKINGLNTLNIVAGDNIEIEQEDDTMTISSTGGSTYTAGTGIEITPQNEINNTSPNKIISITVDEQTMELDKTAGEINSLIEQGYLILLMGRLMFIEEYDSSRNKLYAYFYSGGYATKFTITGNQVTDYESLDVVYDNHYTHTDNNYTNADKTKLDGLENKIINVNADQQTMQLDKSADEINEYLNNGYIVMALGYQVFRKEYNASTHTIQLAIFFGAFGQVITVTGNQVTDVSEYFYVSDQSYVHTDNNFTSYYKNKLDNAPEVVDLTSYQVGDTINDVALVSQLMNDSCKIKYGDTIYSYSRLDNNIVRLYTVMSDVDHGEYIALIVQGNDTLLFYEKENAYWEVPSNRVQNLDNPTTETYPSTLAVYNALQNIGGSAFYLGNVSDYTQQNPLDLDKLELGLYAFNPAGSSNTIYAKATNNGQNVTGTLTANGSDEPRILYLEITQKVKNMTLTTSFQTFGNFYIDSFNESAKRLEYKSQGVVAYLSNNTPYVTSNNSANKTTFNLVTTGGTQTITAKKTFSVLPESSVVPTTDDQLVNKKYVDDNAGGGISPFGPSISWNNIVTTNSPTKALYPDFFNQIQEAYNYSIDNNLEDSFGIITSGVSNAFNPSYLVGFYTAKKNSKQITIVMLYTPYKNNAYKFEPLAYYLIGLTTATYDSDGKITSMPSSLYITPTLFALSTENQISYTPTRDYHPSTKKYVDDKPTTYTGYDATKTQVLKNINGTLTWVDET